MRRRAPHLLVRLNRFSGWGLFILFPILLITGYGITGKYRWTMVVATAELHSRIHKFVIPISILFFVVHSAINIHFSLRRHRLRRKPVRGPRGCGDGSRRS